MASSGLGGKILDVLRRWIEGALKFVLDVIFWPIEQFIGWLGHVVSVGALSGTSPPEMLVAAFQGEVDLVKRMKEEYQKRGSPAALFMVPVLLGALTTAIGFAITVVALRPVRYYLNSTFSTEYPSADEAAFLAARHLISDADMVNWGRKEGYRPDFTHLKKLAAEQLPTFDQLGALHLRGAASIAAVEHNLRRGGYTEWAVKALPGLFYYIPPPPDLIHMAVREAFSPDIAQRFGQYEDFPPAFAQYAQKQGVSPEWAQRYWAAHWDLPGVTQGFEMLHRGAIDQGTMNMLLRALDVMPFWRDKLTAISYAPYTRVDVRRMYKAGYLTFEEVIRAYLDVGYPVDKATKMAQWTVSLAETNEGEIAKSSIVDAFTRKMIDRPTAKAMLIDIGNDEVTAEFYLGLVDFKQVSDKKKQVIANVKKRFEKGTIDENEVIARLSAQNLPSDEILEYLDLWKLTRGGKTFALPIGDLKKFFKEAIIDESEFRGEMANRGTPQKYIDWYVESISKGIELPSLSEEAS